VVDFSDGNGGGEIGAVTSLETLEAANDAGILSFWKVELIAFGCSMPVVNWAGFSPETIDREQSNAIHASIWHYRE
jgi:hypothetical protein